MSKALKYKGAGDRWRFFSIEGRPRFRVGGLARERAAVYSLLAMRILFLSPQLPHRRVRSGPAIVYQRIRRLTERGHEVGLASFVSKADREFEPEVRGEVFRLFTRPQPTRSHPARRLWRALAGPPAPFGAWRDPEMKRGIGDLVEADRYRVVIAEFSVMGDFLARNPWLPAARTVISCHGCATVARQQRCDLMGYGPVGLFERLQRDRLRRYEFSLYRSVDRVLSLTPEERYQLLSFAPDLRTAVIPYGVDTDYFRPPPPEAPRAGLVFTGYYADEPNRDAVRWFVESVWPRLRDRHAALTLTLVGPNPTPAMLGYAKKDSRIIVTGEVDDVRAYLNRAAIFVCPVRQGSGMRGKILEAMAAGTPVVTTSLGAAGIPAQPGENCLLADDPEVMARQIDLLVSDAALCRLLAANARRMVCERLSWDLTVRRLEETLNALVRG